MNGVHQWHKILYLHGQYCICLAILPIYKDHRRIYQQSKIYFTQLISKFWGIWRLPDWLFLFTRRVYIYVCKKLFGDSTDRAISIEEDVPNVDTGEAHIKSFGVIEQLYVEYISHRLKQRIRFSRFNHVLYKDLVAKMLALKLVSNLKRFLNNFL